MSAKRFFLKAVSPTSEQLKQSVTIIELPHNQAVYVGRTPEFDIRDTHISRRQLEITADYDTDIVTLNTVGQCFSGCNGYALLRDKTYKLKAGDRIEVRLGYYAYDLVRELVDDSEDSGEEVAEPAEKRAKMADDDTSDSTNNTNDSSNDGYSDSSEVWQPWEESEIGDLLKYTSKDFKYHNKKQQNNLSSIRIAAFDLDSTLIKTRSGAKFPKDGADWQWNMAEVPRNLKHLHTAGTVIIIFTNQSGVGKDTKKYASFKEKIEAIATKIGVPFKLFAATKKTVYRKPITGMWEHMEDEIQAAEPDAIKLDRNNCFYVGDAAGRPDNWKAKTKKDHSTADRLFALNLGVKFHTPEEYFLGSKVAVFNLPEFTPNAILNGLQIECIAGCSTSTPQTYPVISKTVSEIVLMVGFPASGKSFYSKNELAAKHHYVYVCRDVLGSWERCVKKVEEALKSGRSAVVDNTNLEVTQRARYLDLAKKHGVACRCFLMMTSFAQAKHNNKFRELTDTAHHAPVNDFVMNTANKRYQKPELSEGFSEIVPIPFIPAFKNAADEKLYKMYLLET